MRSDKTSDSSRKLVPLRPREAVAKIAEDSSRVIFTRHAEQRMIQRNITRVQVLRCLRHGRLVEGPAPGIKGDTEMTLEVISAGGAMDVVAALKEDGDGGFVVVITTYVAS